MDTFLNTQFVRDAREARIKVKGMLPGALSKMTSGSIDLGDDLLARGGGDRAERKTLRNPNEYAN